MIKTLINGCNGRMGQEVVKAILDTPEIEILCGVDKIDNENNSFPVFTDISKINLIPDVIIDFSIPEATFNILEFAKKNKIPTVVATTGFSEEQLEKIEEYSNEFPIFRSANMSYETNLMAKLVAELAQKLPDSDIEIVETHHNRKIDSPSGTALILADSINNSLNNEMYYEYNRHSKREKRNPKEIGIHSIRGGNEVGKHTVLFFGNNESFEITHTVNSRGVFANGAVKAAFFIVNKEPGHLYNMNDMF
ncbi:MAG: 4-hydroxy-tetrahydrodipicolinate reductase [Clostridia bacterium]|nr:4-hydroxy-tetrahydrodipicolinate reductase [Clostridia bacterium]